MDHGEAQDAPEGEAAGPAVRADGRVYVMPEQLEFSVKVALATGRPLLLRGSPGSGKSTLAPFIARQLGWRYYEHVVTHRTQPRELLWRYDSVRRLGDAQVYRDGDHRPDDAAYVQPGVLWWALAPASAARRGRSGLAPRACRDPYPQINEARSRDHAVVLIDEIDKADPDLPNSLLVPLGTWRFVVEETGAEIRGEPPATGEESAGEEPLGARHLIVITTNEERELPQAFLRRCVVTVLHDHDREMLLRIAEAHLTALDGEMTAADSSLARAVADQLLAVREQAVAEDFRPPSTAEYLDALIACRTLGIRPGTEEWSWLTDNVLIKRQQLPEASGDR
ncbi:AAA family ATPase [Streptomyces sp. NPDC051940]|uniref:AAA family ATPase n=1 Tax=Streptomyces sp. NPDC051940 TaxID=3155675 RepID=UPI00342C3030